MGDSYSFAVDVLRTVCDRLATRAADLRLMVETTSSFEEWLNWEAFLACKLREADYPFCEVTAKPTHSNNLVDEGGDLERGLGDLMVGGSYDESDHRWVFAEFALLHDGNRVGGKWLQKIEADADKLKRLGWKLSASLLIVVAASTGDVLTEWADYLAGSAVLNQPALTDPFVLALPGGGSVVVTRRSTSNATRPTYSPGRLTESRITTRWPSFAEFTSSCVGCAGSTTARPRRHRGSREHRPRRSRPRSG